MATVSFTAPGPAVPGEVVRALAWLLASGATADAALGVTSDEAAERVIAAAEAFASDFEQAAFAVPALDGLALERVWRLTVEAVALGGGVDAVAMTQSHGLGATFASAALLAAMLSFQKDLLGALYKVESFVQGRAVTSLNEVDRAAAGLMERARRRVTTAGEALRAIPLGDRLPGEEPANPEWAPRVLAILSKRFRVQLRAVEGRWAALDAVAEAAATLRQVAHALLRASIVLDRGMAAARLAVAQTHGADTAVAALAASGDGVQGYDGWPLASAALLSSAAACLAAANAILPPQP